MDIIGILEGLISSVPEAIQLFHRIAPLISQRADISDAQIAEVNAAVPVVHEVVSDAHKAIQLLIDAHKLPTM